VGALNDIAPGKYYKDETAGRIYIGDDPTQFEAIKRTYDNRAYMADLPLVDIQFIGGIFEGYAPGMQIGAISQLNVSNNLILQNVVTRYNAGVGYILNNGGEARNCISEYNAQMGAGAGGNSPKIIGGILRKNNIHGTPFNNEAGACKFANTVNAIIDGVLAIDNFGRGTWADINNRDILITNVTAYGNGRAGIYTELSPYGAKVWNCKLYGNQIAPGINGYDRGQLRCENHGYPDFRNNVITVPAGTAGKRECGVAFVQNNRSQTSVIHEALLQGNQIELMETANSVYWSAINNYPVAPFTVTAQDNVYRSPDVGEVYYYGQRRTLASLQASGVEARSTENESGEDPPPDNGGRGRQGRQRGAFGVGRSGFGRGRVVG
jgi:hypothetical protein